MLYGGVILCVIDATGGLAGAMGIQKKVRGEALETKLERTERISIIDLLVDFASRPR